MNQQISPDMYICHTNLKGKNGVKFDMVEFAQDGKTIATYSARNTDDIISLIEPGNHLISLKTVFRNLDAGRIGKNGTFEKVKR